MNEIPVKVDICRKNKKLGSIVHYSLDLGLDIIFRSVPVLLE